MVKQRIEDLASELGERLAEECVAEDEFVPALRHVITFLQNELRMNEVEPTNPSIVG